MLNLSCSVLGGDEWKRTLGLMGSRLKNLRPVWEAWAIDFRAKEAHVFDAEGAVAGFGRWAPLSPAYAARKKQDGFGTKILVRTGTLKSSLSSVGSQHITKITPQSLEIGSSVPYGKYHQSGTSKMKARPPIRVTEAQRRFLIQLVQRFALAGPGGLQRDHL